MRKHDKEKKRKSKGALRICLTGFAVAMIAAGAVVLTVFVTAPGREEQETKNITQSSAAASA